MSNEPLSGQCSNFSNTIGNPFFPNGNICNTNPGGTAYVCVNYNISFSSGNASYAYGFQKYDNSGNLVQDNISVIINIGNNHGIGRLG